MIRYSFLLSAMLVAGCNNSSKTDGSFKLSGEIAGVEDNTLFYLDYNNNGYRDSTRVINGHFEFSGKLHEKAEQVILSDKNNKNYKFIWLEPGYITFKAQQGKFSDARISGSKTQQLDEELDKILAPIHQKMDNADTDEEFEQLDVLQREESIKFVKNNPGSIISVKLLDDNASQVGVGRTKLLFDNLSDEMKATRAGKAVQQYLALAKDIAIGKPFADITQYTPNGTPIKLSDLKGHVILLDFWASWCQPCRDENPNQVKNFNLYKDKGFRIYAISVDNTKANWLDAIKKDGLNYTNVSERNGEKNTAAIVYGIYQYPTNYLIGKNGIIIAKDLRGEELTQALKKIYN